MAAASVVRRTRTGGIAARLLRPLATIVAVAALLVVGGWQVIHHGPFSVQTVQVLGADGADADSVRAASELAGEQLVAVDARSAATRVEALPWVQSATVTTAFPRSATVTITERTPIAVWQDGGVPYLVDATGLIIGTADSAGDLPAVDASSEASVQVGDRLDRDPLLAAQQVSQFARDTLRQPVTRIAYTRAGGLVVTMGKGLQVQLGASGDLNYELAVWRALAQNPHTAATMHILDLRGDRPYYR